MVTLENKAAVYEVWNQASRRHFIRFLSTRGPPALTYGFRADASLLPLPWHSFSPAALPSPRAGGERRGRKNAHARRTHFSGTFGAATLAGEGPAVGWRLLRPGRNARTTVYPCDACHGKRLRRHHPLPCTLQASWTPSRVHPSNERCPCRSPGGKTATLRLLHRSDRHAFTSLRVCCWLFTFTVTRPQQTLAAHPAAPATALSSSRSNASLSRQRPRATRLDRPNATARSTASAPRSRCQPCVPVCCRGRNAAHTID